MLFTRPQAWPGTPAEAAANRNTHSFYYYTDPNEVPRCDRCDCRYGGTVADWPCGTRVPTETIDPKGTRS